MGGLSDDLSHQRTLARVSWPECTNECTYLLLSPCGDVIKTTCVCVDPSHRPDALASTALAQCVGHSHYGMGRDILDGRGLDSGCSVGLARVDHIWHQLGQLLVN